MKSSNWCNRSSRRGITLVEVVVGIALLATLLVMILLAFRAHATQIRQAQDRLEAIRLADTLLAVAWSGSGTLHAGQQAELPDHPGWLWRVVPGASPLPPALSGGTIVQLEIVAREPGVSDRRLTQVELLVSPSSTLVPVE